MAEYHKDEISVSQNENLSGGSKEMSVSKLIPVIGKIQLLVVLELRPLLPLLAITGNHFQPSRLPQLLAVWSSPRGKSTIENFSGSKSPSYFNLCLSYF